MRPSDDELVLLFRWFHQSWSCITTAFVHVKLHYFSVMIRLARSVYSDMGRKNKK